MDVPLLGQSAAKARDDVRKHADEPRIIEAVTAFRVLITPDGRCLMEPDPDAEVITERAPTSHDVISACTAVITDVTRMMLVQDTVVTVLGNMSRMHADPQYQQLIEQAREQARIAAAAAAGAS